MAVRAGGGRERYYARSGPSTGTSSLVPAYPYPGSSLDAAFVANAYTWGRNSLDANFESTAAGAYFYQPSFAMPSYSNLPDFITGIGGTFTRASTATYFDNTGTLQTAASGVPRIGQLPGVTTRMGYLAEEARTNSISNNTATGAVAGTPGTSPTGWSIGGLPTGTVRTLSNASTENGITYLDIQISGVAAAGGTIFIVPENGFSIVASSGQTWASSVYLRIPAGSLTNVSSIRAGFTAKTSGGGPVADYLAADSKAAVLAATNLATARQEHVAAISGGTIGCVQPLIYVTIAAAGAVDITLRIGLPQLELGAFATSPIPTSSGAVTRAADVLSLPTTGWYSASAGTWFVEFLSFDGTSTVQRPFSASNGTTANLNEVLFLGPSNATQTQAVAGANRTSGGVVGQTPINAINKFAFGIDAAGVASASNGNTVSALVSADTMPTITTLNISNRFDGIRPMSGFVYRLFYIPSRESNATIQALTA